jgi:hypothetical protein
MSLEMLVFLKKSRIPERESIQSAVEVLGVPLQLGPTLNLNTDRGFSPSIINGVPSGFEIGSQSAQELIPIYPAARGIVGGRDWAILFRWGSSMHECACVLGAAAALVKLCDAVAYYPADDVACDLVSLLNELQACLREM